METRVVFFAIAVGLGAGCSGKTAASPATGTGGGGGANVGGSAGSAGSETTGGTGGAAGEDGGESPAYLVATCIYGPDTSTGYVVALDSLDEGSAPSLDRALEIAGCGVIAGPERRGVFFVGESESPIISRFTWNDGAFREGGSISLAGLGITDAAYQQGQFVFLSDEKAYIVSGKGAPEVIVWNPEAMEIVQTISIDGLERDGLYPAFGYTPHVVDGKLFVSARWRNDDGFLRENALVVIDTETDSVVNVASDERCGDLLYSVIDAHGDIYFTNGPYATAFRLAAGEASAPPSCALRVRAGESSFDPDFERDLTELVGGREASSLTRGPDGTAFLQVFHDDVAPLASGTEWYELFDAAGWRWWRVDLELTAAEELTELPFGAAAFDPFPVGERTYQTLPTEFYTDTTFVEMTASGGVPAEGRTVPGWVTGVMRIR